uniref:RPM1-interacting protein n=1 Tax=Saccharum hybrid cultivar R570 TaxID=131158 RepID=A0A059Q277_9POAL|nr:RPM1-interacting protein [Saccharum hybrid cultivar R570]
MAGNGGNIPKFGEWKTTDGGSPYTMYFENARKQRNNSGITVPPGASPARTNTVPSGHRTPPRAPDVKPVKQQDGANRSRNQAKGSSVPTWGQWNESNSGVGAQQYTIVFDQLREERRSAPPTPSIEQLQRPTQNRPTHRDLYDHVPKVDFCILVSPSF